MSPGTRGAIGVVGFALALSGLVAFMGNPFSGPFGGPSQPSSGGTSTEEPTFTSTQTDGGAAFVIPTGGKVCLNGEACTVYVAYDGGTVGVNGAPLEVPEGFVDGVLAAANVDVPGHTFIAQAADGEYGFRNLNNARVDFGAGTTDYCQTVVNEVQCASPWQFVQVEVDTIGAATPSRDKIDLFFPRPYPFASLSTCDSDHQGVLKTLTTDGRTYQCNGTVNQSFAFRSAWSGALDFAVFASSGCQTLTFTATGAALDEPLSIGGCGSVMNGDGYLSCDVAITATNTASVRVCCGNTLGCSDLASITFSAAALR